MVHFPPRIGLGGMKFIIVVTHFKSPGPGFIKKPGNPQARLRGKAGIIKPLFGVHIHPGRYIRHTYGQGDIPLIGLLCV